MQKLQFADASKPLFLMINSQLPISTINNENSTANNSFDIVDELSNIIGYAPEEWRSLAVIDYPNYEISSYGRIKNIIRKQYMGLYISKSGYKNVTLSNGKSRNFLVHRLVAKIFLPQNDITELTVDHINRNRQDNHISNLRWANKKNQIQNRVIVSGKARRPLNQYDLNGNFIARYESLKAAGNAGFGSRDIIYEICSGNRESFKGYFWRYADTEYLPGEIWCQISFENCEPVTISNKGRVIHRKNRILIGTLSNGYHHVALKSLKTGKYRHICVHRLVIAAFKGENSQMVVNHLDGNTSNNNLENLEYVTHQQNSQHAVDTGLISRFTKPVIITNKDGKETRYNSGKLAADAMNVSRSHISDLCSRGHLSRKGFKCRYEL